MALHGTIEINGEQVAGWSAQRLEPLRDEDQVSLYHCWYEEFDFWTRNQTDFIAAAIEHRYSDGAAALASKVLQLAEGGWGS